MWQASWIWGSGEESPRNEWRCFRKTFRPSTNKEVNLKITADSRYVLFVNGKQVGRGPVRSWPFELAYDDYPIGHLLKAGEDNTIAVLVINYGLANFQYLLGRGGLLVQVEASTEEKVLAVTDASWSTAVHLAHDTSSSRISCQLGFTERIDARAWDDSWTTAGFDDSAWASANVIGSVGMEPWTSLVERTIPYLTEEPVYPARIESLHYVKPVSWSAVVDLRAMFVPSSITHANTVQYTGLLAAIIRLPEAASFTIGSVDDGRIPLRASLNGKWFDSAAYTGESPQKFVNTVLPAGDHFLVLDVSGSTHGHGYHIGFECTSAFEILSPQAESKVKSPFLAIGPFDWSAHIDHQDNLPFPDEHPDFVRAKGLSSVDEIEAFVEWLQPIPDALYSKEDVYSSCVWKQTDLPQPIPQQLQLAACAGSDAGIIPMHAELDTEIVIDFGRELSGYVAFELDAPEGTIIDGYAFEYMRDGWIQHTYELDNTFRYICREGRQAYTSFIRRGFRYLILTVRGADRPIKLIEVKTIHSSYPVANVGSFHSSNSLLNEIWRISRDTTRLCMEDTFVDCPAFEQVYWVGDARNASLVNYYAFGSKEIVERCLRLVPGSAFQSPLYADQVPSGWSSVIPNWTFFWITACYEYYHFTGDVAFARSMWPKIEFTLQHYLKKLDGSGLLHIKGWNLLDWAPFEQPVDGIVTPQNMFLVKALRDASRLAEAAGDSAQGASYVEQASLLHTAINQKLWDEERHAYLDCIHPDGSPSKTISMQTQVVACLCDIAEGERARIVRGYIFDAPADFIQIGSPFMSFFYYEALAKLGRIDLMTADMLEQYGVMVEYGATSVWEVYPISGITHNPNMKTRSHCHAWSAGPVYFLGAHVLGVRGVTPGWTKVTVSPSPVGLTWARGTVPLPGGGRIDVSWRVEENSRQMTLRIGAPSSVELEVIAPAGYELIVEKEIIG
ncbi:hypothetical protein Back11_00780 [Paenibacillus baekrokdamisoli]|uniref:Uncharacterized protein n=1 Tax=Paenibacillus baekrokdamisoli TaxID=1712516 RepID=A0A3G9J224_9BACL|nr:family 78 glycoside hydrolase catalytic domain [Paenibacillus baekrokdamisoli]MBB3069294.1 hypothetical protein [Paenibacillus baekrokdamisoli]BBH18733.1 hypothetical protein Back11_00780 [Paenibacillus baekrokdamisoli]